MILLRKEVITLSSKAVPKPLLELSLTTSVPAAYLWKRALIKTPFDND
ncbi:hypothetical protein ACFGVS_14370 [Mucilaginibacter sp. AW1-7]